MAIFSNHKIALAAEASLPDPHGFLKLEALASAPVCYTLQLHQFVQHATKNKNFYEEIKLFVQVVLQQ